MIPAQYYPSTAVSIQGTLKAGWTTGQTNTTSVLASRSTRLLTRIEDQHGGRLLKCSGHTVEQPVLLSESIYTSSFPVDSSLPKPAKQPLSAFYHRVDSSGNAMAPRPLLSLFTIPLLLSTLCLLMSADGAQTQSRPKALVAQVTRDAATLQYVMEIQQKTPLQKERLVLDIGGEFLWVQCNGAYKSSTYHPVRCRTALCRASGSIACGNCSGPAAPGCSNDTCGVFPENTVTRTSTGGELSQDVVALSSTDGKNPGARATVPRFAFSCAPRFLVKGLASGVAGMAGLSRARLALPTQLSAAFSFNRKFAICLPGGNVPGAVFFGNEPYFFLPGRDVSRQLIRTPLLKNPKRPNDYFIGVKSIVVNGTKVPIDSAKLKFDREGRGGTRLSTVVAYTQAATPIYSAIRDAFVNSLKGIPRVNAVKPFDTCFPAKAFGSTRVGPAVPSIDLVLQNEKTTWVIFGANSMVQVSDDVLCLAFVDGGADPVSSIVIGSYQMQDNLLQFDLATSTLGFTSSLLFTQTTCSNFNFTSSV